MCQCRAVAHQACLRGDGVGVGAAELELAIQGDRTRQFNKDGSIASRLRLRGSLRSRRMQGEGRKSAQTGFRRGCLGCSADMEFVA